MQVFNTLGRALQPFQPRDNGKVGIYVCGPTVQARPHLGHGRAAVAFDVIRRYLSWRGFDVTYVQNVTDVEDKIIAAAKEEGVPAAELADQFARAFSGAYRTLGVQPPDIEPRATEHIPEMIAMITTLIERGHAYEANGDVYFAVRTLEGYGKLSGRNIDDLVSGARIEPGEHKRDPLDFAVWKAAKPDEPCWASPWGEGRPGWHIECSAMANKYLGLDFDIHAGGTDLIFPHHENEIAQAEGALGERFARYWLHNGLVNLKGEKMSKSTGHVVDLIEALDLYPPQAVRLFYLRTHYRKPLDFSEEAIQDAIASLERLWSFRRRRPGPVAASPDPEAMGRVMALMDDDFDTAGSLGVVFEAVREGNRRLDAGEDADALVAAFDQVLGLFGLLEELQSLDDLAAPIQALGEQFGAAADAPDAVVDELIALRSLARQERDWDTADAIRSGLAEIGITIEDVRDGARWHRR
ncbi:MAG TPA: cysteine--tRNA ligase [Acidimicrobiia bacterium]|jgi:cysteinyl-tRNA synthetase|nr:cysteine--tRNA ligase [Acidimicrobiia bacterium]